MSTKKEEPQKLEIKNVKHTFTDTERNGLGSDLARCIGGLRGIEGEFDQVKASFKAKITESEARIDNLSTSLVNGFEMRNKKCRVVFRPKDRLKDYFLEESKNGDPPVVTEEMTRDDFQADLLMAESKFDFREEIQLFQPQDNDAGILVVGKLAGNWFTALRVRIGKLELTERLDSEQRAFKKRPDAVSHAVKRANAWAKDNLKDLAQGFQASFESVIEAHKEREE